MKIKLAILEKDQGYLNRIVTAFSTKYADKFEVYSFTDQAIAMKEVEDSRIEVLIASDDFEIDCKLLPKRCGFAYFVESADIETIGEQPAICKFQKADMIYKQILSLYAEKAESVSGLKFGDENTKIIVFASPCGGTGTSTVAAACATYYAKKHKTLYLNLEKFGGADSFFSAPGQFDMSDIIYSLKSKKSNLAMKLESCVRQTEKGVCYFSQPQVALDMMEITLEDAMRLISELQIIGSYDYIIMDVDFSLNKQAINFYKQAHACVWVGDGSEISNTKIKRAHQALTIIEQDAESPLTGRLCMMYNKFSSKTGKTISDINIKNIGGAPKYENATSQQIIEQLGQMDMFGKVF